MDRRFLTVLGVSLVFALVVSSIFYQMTSRSSGGQKKIERVETRDLVVATRPLPVGVSVKPPDVKVIKVSAEAFPKGAFSKVEEVIDRPVISNVLLDEPILEGRLAARGSGLGLAPVIPVGMRAVTVGVNEVVGVAGFVLPGMRVDVLLTGSPPGGAGRMTTTVLQNSLVLSAGQAMQADARGQPISAPTVTLLVTPEQAETITLAGNEGRIQLVLRNGSDQTIEKTSGRVIGQLFSGFHKQAPTVPEGRKARPKPPAAAPVVALAPPPPPKPAPPDEVMIIRGTNKTVEVVGLNRSGETRKNP
ncbi:MAG: Flp pilus assembly protein CpaB [Acidobacteria bacterium]|nr:Flp pilus assembly protein CpaB [Acidobacteriota bacterium]